MTMDLELSGKVALIFGASGGLGGAIASALAREGAHVAISGRDVSALTQAAAQIRTFGSKVLELPWDLGETDLIDPQFSRIETELGAVDILINNTGGPPPGPVTGIDPAVWEAQFRSMALSVIKITDRALPNMRKRQWGRIITSTSSGVVAPIPNLGVSNTLRSTLLGWSKTLAGEVAKDGITSNVVLPGRIATTRIRALDEARAAREGVPVSEVSTKSRGAIPVGRYGCPDEYGDVVAFLASTRASYVTGSVIRIDGGYISSI
jgi:3-oxoacyl-[acyl-carrier protein] reductase